MDKPKGRLRKLLPKLALSLATLLGLAVLLEIGVRLFVSEETFRPLANIYAATQTKGVGYTLRPGYQGTAFGASLAVNQHGFRGPDWPRRRAGRECRIALIGDSHAFGFGVRFEDTVGEQLAREMSERDSPCTVLNFAAPGYNSGQQAALFHEVALGFEPDLVVVLLCNNDDDPPMWADADGWLHMKRTSNIGTDNPITSWQDRSFQRFSASLLARSRLLLYLRILWFRYQHREEHENLVARLSNTEELLTPVPEGMELSKELRASVYEPLSKIATTCKERDIPLVFAAFASPPDWRVLLRSLGREHGVASLELLGLFPDASSHRELLEKFSLGWDTHLGAEAHRRWAQAMADTIRSKKLLRAR